MKLIKYTLASLLIFTGCAAFSQLKPNVQISGMSGFAMQFSGIFFTSPEQALEAYIGNWAGEQALYVDGEEIMTAMVQQSYIPAKGENMRLIGSGKISAGELSVPTRCYMSVENDRLLLEIVTADGELNSYAGFIKGETIEWVPKYFFMLYDYQSDTFFRTDRGVAMISNGRRYIEVKEENFKGFLDLKCELFKDDASLPLGKIRSSGSTRFDIPNLEMQN